MQCFSADWLRYWKMNFDWCISKQCSKSQNQVNKPEISQHYKNNNNIMQLLLLTPLLLLLLKNASATSSTEAGSTPSTDPNTSSSPLTAAPADTDNKQTVVSTCRAMRNVMDHNGGIAQWKAKCRVEVWAGTEQPEFKDLTEEQKAQVQNSVAEPSKEAASTSSESSKETVDKSKLADEAKLRHFMCMEARKSILSSLKSQLPAGVTSKDQVVEAMRTLNLSPELEAFMGKIDSNMKESLAAIHAIQQNTQMPDTERQESLRSETTKLTGLIDEQCKDEHPTIRYHDVGYLPHPDLEKVHMTLLISRPGKRLEFFNLPENAYARHVEYLRNMVEAAAHHAEVTGEKGEFEVLHHPLPNPLEDQNSRMMGDFDSSHPAVISVLKAKDQTDGTLQSPQVATPVISSASDNSAVSGHQVADLVPDVEKSPISEYWSNVFAAETEYQESMRALSSPSVSKSEIQVKSKDASTQFERQISDSTRKLVNSQNIAAKNPEYGRSTSSFWKKSYDKLSPDQKLIEERYQKSKALLKEAREYAKHKRTMMEILKGVQTLPEKVYEIGKRVINDIREHEKQSLDAVVPLPSTQQTPVASQTTPSDSQALPLAQVAQAIQSPNKEAIDKFIDEIAEANKKKGNERENAINAAINELLKENNIDLIAAKPENYEPSTKNYWKKPYMKLDKAEKDIELPYQKKKELLTEAEKALPLVKGRFLWSPTLSKEVYNSGKAIIDAERKVNKKAIKSNSKTVGSGWLLFGQQSS
jgi:hypothetical protein